ncbi:MAG: hypothetical protein WD827_04475 [Solirubrobacterales bacterium]
MNHLDEPLSRIHEEFQSLRVLAIRLWAANMVAIFALWAAVLITNT